MDVEPLLAQAMAVGMAALNQLPAERQQHVLQATNEGAALELVIGVRDGIPSIVLQVTPLGGAPEIVARMGGLQADTQARH